MTFFSRPIKSRILLLSFLTVGLVGSCYAESKYNPPQSPEFIQELISFSTIYTHIKNHYVDEVDDKTLFENAIKGMLEGLDPYSTHLNPADQADLMESTTGKFGGLGIVIASQGEFIQIISPIDDTPAYRAGLQAGDIILKIGEQEVSEINLQEGVKLMRGLPGTIVSLTISRAEKMPFSVEIEREIITITSVKGYLLDEGIGYIRISNFQLPSAKLLKEVVKKITTKNKSKLNSLIIDLRNNPGGALSAAIDISDLFIDKNDTVVYTEGRSERTNISFDAKRGDITNGAPIVVLINEGSASASEIVAGALQDHKRATIMGQKSFGKGSVQSLLDLEDGYGMKLTTARFYTPLGHVIQDNGITPDIILDTHTESESTAQDLTTEEQGEDEQLREDPTKLNATEILKRQDAITEKTNQEIIEYLMQDHDIKEAINYLMSLTQEQTI